jgi:hypothetical protein
MTFLALSGPASWQRINSGPPDIVHDPYDGELACFCDVCSD